MDDLEIHLYPCEGRPTTAEEHAVDAVRARLAKYAKHVQHVKVRLARMVGARGKLDRSCRVEVTLTKILDAPKFFVEGRAQNEREAAELAADAALGAVRREVEDVERRRGSRRRKAAGKKVLAVRRAQETEAEIEIPLDAAAEAKREDASRRHLTPRKVKSAHPQRGRHIHKTQRQARATSARELSSTTRPSRKSTRKSANRSKRDSNQARRNERAVRSPEARAGRESAVRSRRAAATS